MKKRILGFVIIIFLVGFFSYCKKNESPEKTEEYSENLNVSEKQSAVPVVVEKIKRGTLPLRLSITGKTFAKEKTKFKALTSGYVDKIYFKEGDFVKKGDVIVKLKNREAELTLKDAEAQRLKAMAEFVVIYKSMNYLVENPVSSKEFEKVKDEYKNALELFKQGKISRKNLSEKEKKLLEFMIDKGALQEEVQKVVSGLTKAEIELEKARIEYERTYLKAPFSGIISEIKVSPGERVERGDEVFTIINLSSMIIKADALETEIKKISKGQRVRIKFISYPDKLFYGKIFAISPQVDEEKKTVTIFIKFKNPGYIYDGMNCNVEVEWKTLKNVIKVPKKAVIVRSGRPLVFVVENDIALWRYIKVGESNNEEVEVKEGVSDGEYVVTEGQLTLAHQSRVKIIKKE